MQHSATKHVNSAPEGRGTNPASEIAGVLLALMLLVSGGSKLAGYSGWLALFQEFGYPLTLVPVTGALEVLSAILLVPRLSREYGAVIAVFVFASAALSHLVTGGWLWAAFAVALGVLSGWLMWHSRSDGPNSHPPVGPRDAASIGSYPATQNPS